MRRRLTVVEHLPLPHAGCPNAESVDGSRTHPHVLDELAWLELDFFDALRQGPILAAIVLLLALLVIVALLPR